MGNYFSINGCSTYFTVLNSDHLKNTVYTIFTLSIQIPQLLTIIVLKFEKVQFYYLLLCLIIAECVANSADPDEMPHSVASHLGLHCLLTPVCPNTYSKYSTLNIGKDR